MDGSEEGESKRKADVRLRTGGASEIHFDRVFTTLIDNGIMHISRCECLVTMIIANP